MTEPDNTLQSVKEMHRARVDGNWPVVEHFSDLIFAGSATRCSSAQLKPSAWKHSVI